MQTAWSTTEVLLGCKRRVALRILSSVFKHPLHQHDKDQADLKHLKNSAGRAPRLYETGGSSSTYGAPTITPVKTIAANSASKLNKGRGTSGLVSYLSDSIA